MAQAERIRSTFAEIAREVDGRPVAATVSIGIAVNQEQSLDVGHCSRKPTRRSIMPRSAVATGLRSRRSNSRYGGADAAGDAGDGQKRRMSGFTGDRTGHGANRDWFCGEPEARVVCQNCIPTTLGTTRHGERETIAIGNLLPLLLN